MRIAEAGKNFLRTKVFTKVRTIFNPGRSRLEREPKTDVYLNGCENTPGIKSKTVEQLFSPEFTPSKRYTENGMRITTIIDRETNKPVEAFVIRIQEEDPQKETYYIMVKNENGGLNIGGENFEVVGHTKFFINKDKEGIIPKDEIAIVNKNFIFETTPSYMEALENKKYKGIGVRLVQLKVERMMQEGLRCLEIVADGDAFPFHYKMGFRLAPKYEPYTNENALKHLKYFSSVNGKSIPENGKFIEIFEDMDGQPIIDISHTLENFLLDYYQNGGKKLYPPPNMFLDQTSYDQWVKYILQQPILL